MGDMTREEWERMMLANPIGTSRMDEQSMTNQTPGFDPLAGIWNGRHMTQSQVAELPVDPFSGKMSDQAKMMAEMLMGATTAPAVIRGGVVHRFTNAGPDTGVGYMMFADDVEKVKNVYGKNHYTVDVGKIPPKEIVDASSFGFKKKVMAALKDAEHITDRYQTTAKELTRGVDPSDIVNSAQMWDSPDIVEAIWERVMEPNGWAAVRTPNGLVTFDPAHVAKAGKK